MQGLQVLQSSDKHLLSDPRRLNSWREVLPKLLSRMDVIAEILHLISMLSDIGTQHADVLGHGNKFRQRPALYRLDLVVLAFGCRAAGDESRCLCYRKLRQ
ncbi:hypothetical protein AWC04_00165 [Mycolicibacterium fallax]|uniref:Uncharacterized protein n=1 Tax=Mycolicibacterium fallax TaxID=1793 RepID=A0A1X1REV3_MYCFA|nr:hypothetical protein AWC04_00165 [Mycolicibacterium fallax]